MAKKPAPKPAFLAKKGSAPKSKTPPKSGGKMMKQCKCGGHG